MTPIFYTTGEPQGQYGNYTLYVDLDTDTMYALVDGEWVATHRHGEELDIIHRKEVANDL